MPRSKHDQTELERRLQERASRENQEAPDPSPAENSAEVGDTSGNGQRSSDDETQSRTESLEAEVETLKDQLLRTRAEFDNFRKRTVRENDRIRKTAAESLLRDLLPVLDHLELALQHADADAGPLRQGVELVVKQLEGKLEDAGLRTIRALGEPFDPNLHEAMSQVESASVPPQHVAEEYQRGYILGDIVLRPSRVVVSMGPGPGGGQIAPAAENAPGEI